MVNLNVSKFTQASNASNDIIRRKILFFFFFFLRNQERFSFKNIIIANKQLKIIYYFTWNNVIQSGPSKDN